MKKILLVACAAIISLSSFSQAWEKGDVAIDLYYGYFGGGALVGTYALNTNGEKSVLGPVGLRAQYMVATKFGIGIDASYQSAKATWSGWDEDYINQDYAASYTVTKIKFMVRTSWEFVNTDKFTMNWANSVGYKSTSRLLDANESAVVGGGTPLAFRTALGMRFFLTENINIHADILGIGGGGIVLAGLSFKL